MLKASSVFCVDALKPCADPEEGGQGVRTPLEDYKNIGFLSNTGPDPLKSQIYQSSIQCWAVIGPPTERHLTPYKALAPAKILN